MAVALGEGADGLASDVFEEAGFDRFSDGCFPCGAAESAHGGAEFKEALNGHVVIEGGGFREVADFLFCGDGVFYDGGPGDFYLPFGDGEKAGNHAHGGGFSGSIRS